MESLKGGRRALLHTVWLPLLIPSPQSASIVPMGEVTDSPRKICPKRICQGRQDRYEAAHTWEPRWDQKQQEMVMKARWSEVRSWDSQGCPRRKAGNQKRART